MKSGQYKDSLAITRGEEGTRLNTLKPLLKISTYHQSPENRFHMIAQSGGALSERDYFRIDKIRLD